MSDTLSRDTVTEKISVVEGMIPVQGGRVWHRTVGADRKKVPLLVLHGGPGAPHDYLEPLEHLGKDRPVVFYDQLGCGNSDRPDDPTLWTLDRFVDELARVREALDLQRLHILGQSWGTMLAVEYVLTRKPEGVLSLILSGPCLSVSRFIEDQKAYLLDFPQDVQETIRRSEESGDFRSREYQDAMIMYFSRHLCRLQPWPNCLIETLEKMGLNVYETMWGPSEFTLTGTLKDFERAERLKEIMLPTLFTCGRHDEATPDTTRFYQEMLPGSRMAVLDDASHEHHLEQPVRYLETVRQFLGEIEE
ncbi:MAG TPA: proline iminopeptidase-family hydrolase [Syntrophobacteraceae bacterium]|nr:proline iminopeptidase-family hydrolase [Syntrophobacteraceae bacterium]